MLCEENLNSDGQQFHKYQQITSHPHSLNTKGGFCISLK